MPTIKCSKCDERVRYVLREQHDCLQTYKAIVQA